MTDLVLASASPRRRQLLAQIGVTPDSVQPADINETPRVGEPPRAYAERLGKEKAQAIHVAGQFTLAGDTVVALGRRILPKAETEREVADCLKLISGRAHHVLTSVCLIAPDGRSAAGKKLLRIPMAALCSSMAMEQFIRLMHR